MRRRLAWTRRRLPNVSTSENISRPFFEIARRRTGGDFTAPPVLFSSERLVGPLRKSRRSRFLAQSRSRILLRRSIACWPLSPVPRESRQSPSGSPLWYRTVNSSFTKDHNHVCNTIVLVRSTVCRGTCILGLHVVLVRSLLFQGADAGLSHVSRCLDL